MFLRNLAFNICFIGWALLSSVLFLPLFIFSAPMAQLAGPLWAKGAMWLAKRILGLTYEVRGRQYMTYRPVIYASKHQSAWDTIIFLILFKNPAYVLKRELLRIPGWGWYLWRMRMIAIDRSAGAGAIKGMIRQAKAALLDHRPIVIYPEGTRTAPGEPARYHPGIVALYNALHVPVIPVALNSGYYWGKDAFYKKPGKIIIEFLPPIDPGLHKDEFSSTLQRAIETRAGALLEEAQRTTHATFATKTR